MIMERTRMTIFCEHQWIDWKYLCDKDDPIFEQILVKCKELGVYNFMEMKYDWNAEVV